MKSFLSLILLLSSALPVLAQPSFRDTVLRLGSSNYTADIPAALAFVPSDPSLLLIGTATGSVALVRVERIGPRYFVTEELDTASAGQGRSILGIGADPFDPSTFFVSTSSLFWRDQGLAEDGWQNGKIERLIFDEDQMTIAFDAEPAVSGLPVSLTTLSVNGAVVDPFTGRLLVAIGAFNSGGAPSELEGNLPDCLASAAILEVDIRRGGTLSLEWSGSDPETATLLKTPFESGISIYAEGVRSPYQPALSRFNRVFIIDAGTNFDRGPRSTSCKRSRPFRRSFPDRVLRLRKGEYYGHPNRQRQGQCVFISPLLKPSVAESRFPGYTPPLFTNEAAIRRGDIGSGTTGAAFYDSNLFPSFRGTLLGGDAATVKSTDLEGRKPPGLNAYNLRKKTIVRVGDTPGISLAVNIHGDVFAAQSTLDTIGVALPQAGPARRATASIRSVFPSRGVPGSFVFIVGVGLPLKPAVKIGGKRCPKAKRMPGEELMIRCVVPSFDVYPRRPQPITIGRFLLRTAFTVLNPALAQPSFVDTGEVGRETPPGEGTGGP